MGNPSFWKISLLQPQTLKSIQMLQDQSVMEVISKGHWFNRVWTNEQQLDI